MLFAEFLFILPVCQGVDAFVGLNGDFRQKIVKDHQIAVLPGQRFLVNRDIGNVVDVVLFGGSLQKALPGGSGQGLVVGQGRELIALLFPGLDSPHGSQDAADQHSQAQKPEGTVAPPEDGGDGDACHNGQQERKGAFGGCLSVVQDGAQLSLCAFAADAVVLKIPQGLNPLLSRQVPDMQGLDLKDMKGIVLTGGSAFDTIHTFLLLRRRI